MFWLASNWVGRFVDWFLCRLVFVFALHFGGRRCAPMEPQEPQMRFWGFPRQCMGEEGIKKDVQLRQQLERRWGGMLERRAIRTGHLDAAGAPSCE